MLKQSDLKVYELAVKWPGDEWEIETYHSKEARANRIKHLLSIHPQERPSFNYDKQEED